MTDLERDRAYATLGAGIVVTAIIAAVIGTLCYLSGCCFFAPGSNYWKCPGACYSNWFAPAGAFEVKPNTATPKGVKVDTTDLLTLGPSGSPTYKVDLATIDSRLDKMEACLLEVKAFQLTEEQRQAWGCSMREWTPELLKRRCIQVKVVRPYPSSCHPEWQFINALAPEQQCLAKGIKPTAECPCRWRAGIVDDYKIVTPPALYLWPAVNIATGCTNPWGTKEVPSPFAKCASLGS